MTETRVNVELLHEWLNNHGRQATGYLAYRTRLSTGTIRRIQSGFVPRPSSRLLIARACGLPEEKLFPTVTIGNSD